MANPPRKKGTAYETKLMRRLIGVGFKARRMPMGARWDIEVEPYQWELKQYGDYANPIQALATEPDRGQTLVTLDWNAFEYLLAKAQVTARIECKKHKAFSLHTLWRKEME